MRMNRRLEEQPKSPSPQREIAGSSRSHSALRAVTAEPDRPRRKFANNVGELTSKSLARSYDLDASTALSGEEYEHVAINRSDSFDGFGESRARVRL
jgi:hypothetical protein